MSLPAVLSLLGHTFGAPVKQAGPSLPEARWMSERLSVLITTANGRLYRWGWDEPLPENRPTNLRFGSKVNGGYDTMTCELRRKPGRHYADIEALNPVRVIGPGNRTAWAGRVAETPGTTGGTLSVQAVGWGAHLRDNNFFRALFVDRRLDQWGAASPAYRANFHPNYKPTDPFVGRAYTGDAAVANSGEPAVTLQVSEPWAADAKPHAVAVYDSRGLMIHEIQFFWRMGRRPVNAEVPLGNFTGWYFGLSAADDEIFATGNVADEHYQTSPTSSRNPNATGYAGAWQMVVGLGYPPKRYGRLHLYWSTALAGPNSYEYEIHWPYLAVFGADAVGLTRVGPPPQGKITDSFHQPNPQGLWFHDIVRRVIEKGAPKLRTTGIQTSPYSIEQAAWLDPTTPEAVLEELHKQAMWEYGCYGDDGKEFFTRPIGSGRTWHLYQEGGAEFEDEGVQSDSLAAGVVVTFQNGAGETRTAGPVGSGADFEDNRLLNDDAQNPAVKHGYTGSMLAPLQLGQLAPETAIDLGEQHKNHLADKKHRGVIRMKGAIRDENGMLFPAYEMKAGDLIRVMDASDTSPRRAIGVNYADGVVEAQHDVPQYDLATAIEVLGHDLDVFAPAASGGGG